MKIILVLIMSLYSFSAFSQFSKKDRIAFANDLVALMKQSPSVNKSMYTCMSRAFPNSSEQELQARFNMLHSDKKTFELLVLEIMKAHFLTQRSVIRFFEVVCKDEYTAEELYDQMSRRYYKQIDRYKLKKLQEIEEQAIIRGMDTIKYYSTDTNQPNMISLLLRRNNSIEIKQAPTGKGTDTTIINGKWEIDNSALHLYFDHNDGGFINILFNKGLKDENQFNIANSPAGIEVTTDINNAEFSLINNTCIATLKSLYVENDAKYYEDNSDVVRLYESDPSQVGRLFIKLTNNYKVKLQLISAVSSTYDISLEGVWLVDSVLHLAFKNNDEEMVRLVFDERHDSGDSTQYTVVERMTHMDVMVGFSQNELSLMNNNCKAMLKTNSLNTFKAATFPSGSWGWQNFIQRNLNGQIATKNGAKEGSYRVTVAFDIDETGKIYNIRAAEDPGYGCVEEVIRVISLSPNWIPAFKNGDRIKYTQKQVINFKVGKG